MEQGEEEEELKKKIKSASIRWRSFLSFSFIKKINQQKKKNKQIPVKRVSLFVICATRYCIVVMSESKENKTIDKRRRNFGARHSSNGEWNKTCGRTVCNNNSKQKGNFPSETLDDQIRGTKEKWIYDLKWRSSTYNTI